MMADLHHDTPYFAAREREQRHSHYTTQPPFPQTTLQQVRTTLALTRAGARHPHLTFSPGMLMWTIRQVTQHRRRSFLLEWLFSLPRSVHVPFECNHALVRHFFTNTGQDAIHHSVTALLHVAASVASRRVGDLHFLTQPAGATEPVLEPK